MTWKQNLRIPSVVCDYKVALVYGQMNEPPGARMRVGLPLFQLQNILETFPNRMFCSLLIIYSDLCRLVLNYPHFLGRMPSAVGYQPTLASEMGELKEKSTITQEGSITLSSGYLCSC